MELRHYFKVLLHWWWLVLSGFLIVTVASLVFIYNQPPRYRASSTLVVSPKATLGEFSMVRQSIDVLDKPMIINTYAEVIQSHRIYEQAQDALNLPPASRWSVDVFASVIPQTNLIRVDVEGTDPQIVYDMANTVVAEAIQYIDDLYELYDVKVLDPARLPSKPFSPNIPRDPALGAALGLMLGVGMSFLAEYLRKPLETVESLSIIDTETGLYTKKYFLQRLHEEISRSKRHQRPLAISLIGLNNLGDIENLYPKRTREVIRRQLAAFLKRYLREGEILASWNGKRMALLMPDASEDAARQTVEQLRTRLEWMAFEDEGSGAKFNFAGKFGVVACSCDGITESELLSLAEQALHQAELNGSGGVHVVSRIAKPALAAFENGSAQ
ncbi:MAG: diguanylate cyclase domain-containing protein [Anaerolineae bacterium]